MAAAKTRQSDHGAPPATVARPSWCGTVRYHTPKESCDRRSVLRGRQGTQGTPPQTWCRPPCRSICQSCSPRRHRRPFSRSDRELVLRAASPHEPTSASAPGVGGSPFHPEKLTRNRRPRGPLFFDRAQLRGGLLKRRFVALSFHGVLGPLERKSLLLDDPPQLILAETDTGFFEHMRIQ